MNLENLIWVSAMQGVLFYVLFRKIERVESKLQLETNTDDKKGLTSFVVLLLAWLLYWLIRKML